MEASTSDGDVLIALVPPQLPTLLVDVFNLKPILGNPSLEEVKLVHNAIRALNNLSQTPELRDTEVTVELSQHLFDIQMACHRQRHPVTILPNEVAYDPPNLPRYIPVELKSVTGPPSNLQIASVHTALRISESFANVPSMFDPNLHVELSQHLFDIQLARHIQRSVVKQSKVTPPAFKTPASHGNTSEKDASQLLEGRESPKTTSLGTIRSTELDHLTVEQPNPPEEAIHCQTSGAIGDLSRTNELIIELKETMKGMIRVLVGSQNSLARGFNSSEQRSYYSGFSYDLGAHSLINDEGEVPEAYSLPTFSNGGYDVSFPLVNLTEDVVARYLRFYSIGEEMIQEGEQPRIKSGMIDEAKALLSRRLFLNR